MIELLQNRLQSMKNQTIVELGAGYHEPFREHIAEHNHYIVSDVDLRELPVDPRSRLVIRSLDACNIALDRESVDVACSSMLIMHVEIERHFSEVKRILKKDGVYLFAATGVNHNKELKALGFDPLLDIHAETVTPYGARIIDEECFYEPFIETQEELFWRKFIACETGHLPIDGLTKHYLLFELRPDEKY